MSIFRCLPGFVLSSRRLTISRRPLEPSTFDPLEEESKKLRREVEILKGGRVFVGGKDGRFVTQEEWQETLREKELELRKIEYMLNPAEHFVG